MQHGFLYYYLRSMRLYYCFVTGTTTLAGVVFAHAFLNRNVWTWRDIAVLIVGFLAWGVNQIFSDWCDRHEDKINAPHRPMVSGKLAPKPALALSSSIMVIFAAVSYLVSPWALLFLAIGGGLNLCYSFLKKVPVLNCLIYAMAITCCTLYGFAGSCGMMPQTAWKTLLIPVLFILPAHFLMCSFSYYKDKENYKFNPLWMRELESVSHREYCTGFYFDYPIENAQLASNTGYIREKAYFAIACEMNDAEREVQERLNENTEGGKYYLFMQKNKCKIGDGAEIISPSQVGRALEITDLRDENGNEIESAPHPFMHFFVKVPFDVKVGDILRAGE